MIALVLIDRDYCRGVDFICHEKKVNDLGGVHVIQTFLSETLSEEIQAIGRTARLGDNGSYSMVLCASEFRKLDKGRDDISVIQRCNNRPEDIYALIESCRREYIEINLRTISETVSEKMAAHQKMHDFTNVVKTGNIEDIRRALENLDLQGTDNLNHCCIS